MAEKKKPDDRIYVELFEGESEKVNVIIEYFKKQKAPKKYTTIEALYDYIQKQQAIQQGNTINHQPPQDAALQAIAKFGS
ncbi:hypothetical protein [Brevibacillus laterosporus]|uniref:Uncharacterized protein n=1 Tax=Brevibacillus laterosporus TaxID=1465 RepID=A0AAP3DL33_BRELA|nr:hypothetical protein [Brevibacillus laterosporus]MCR8982436.1 hypothetical protein [Brevibacillus laterosporus]MCZ0809592.1 hypothetical protein [Brevibacillus laterosporus]MCZ0828125.1 hypothetical protein [Brevibacillus laterosporus]MCZ0852147.1 hypothetical protein [Brevibacillus laterosporus]